MVNPKDVTGEESDEMIGHNDAAPAITPPKAAARPTPAPKKGPGAKDVIPFQWKLIGESQGVALTLFKSVEREEAEAQLERVRRDGYYSHLRILDVKEKVKQPPSGKPARKLARQTRPKATTSPRNTRRAAGPPAKRKRTTKAAAARTSRGSPKTVKAKKAKVKTAAGKKPAATRSTKKRAAKRKR